MSSNGTVTVEKSNGKLPWNERLSYGASDFACSFTFSLIGTYLMYFYTDVFGVAADPTFFGLMPHLRSSLFYVLQHQTYQ